MRKSHNSKGSDGSFDIRKVKDIKFVESIFDDCLSRGMAGLMYLDGAE